MTGRRPPLRLLERPALGAAVAFALGVGLAAGLGGWSLKAAGALLAAGTVGVGITLRRARRLVTLQPLARWAALGIVLMGAGVLAATLERRVPPHHVAHALPTPLAQLGGTWHGRIVSYPEPLEGDGVRFVLELDSAEVVEQRALVTGRVQVSLRASAFTDERPVYPRLERGDRVSVVGAVRPLGPRRNPADPDFGAFLERRGVHARLAVYDTSAVAFRAPADGWLQPALNRSRFRVRRALDVFVPGEPARAVLSALLLADRTGISRDQRDTFAETGLMHLLAVSGLHVLLVGLVAFQLLRPITARIWGTRLADWHRSERARVLLTLGLLGGYLLLTGAPTSATRAVVMAALLLVGPLLGRRADTLNVLGVAGLVLLALRPSHLYDVGFQLSFAAVAGIAVLWGPLTDLVPRLTTRPKSLQGRLFRWAGEMTVASVAATAATAPVVLFHFGRLPLAGLVLNLVAIPATMFALGSGLAVVALAPVWTGGAAAYGSLANAAANALLGTAEAGARHLDWTLLSGYVRSPAWLLALVLALAAFAYLKQAPVRRRLSVLALGCGTLALWTPWLQPAPPSVLEAVFLDVGQGDAAVVRLPGGRHLLIDAGPADAFGSAGTYTILPHLRRYGIRRLDAVVVTHGHLDHFGGLEALVGEVPIGRVIASGEAARSDPHARLLQTLEHAGIPVDTVAAGDTLALDPAVQIRVLHPQAVPGPYDDPNEGSVVLHLKHGATGWLFLGDAEFLAEADLLARYGPLLQADVVKVGHHGSITSSAPELVDQVCAGRATDFAVVSVAFRNRYGLPSDEVLERWHGCGARVLETAFEGAVWLRSDGETVARVPWRDEGPPDALAADRP